MINEISKQYAEALFQLASNEEKQEFYKELKMLKIVLLEDETLKVFKHPSITISQKKEIIKNSFEKVVSTTILNFLYVLVDNARIEEIANITDSYKLLLDQELKVLDATIYTKFSLSEEQLTEIKNVLEKKYLKQIRVSEIVNEMLVGGIKIVVGFDEIDATTLSKLQKIKDILKG